MDQILEIVSANVQYAHWIMFGLLLLAGLCVPVSEDAMIFVCALLSIKYPEFQWKLATSVYVGAYFSDLIAYGFLGRYLGPKLFHNRFFSQFVKQKQLDSVSGYYEKYGVMTLVIGRFIPFGVRNALFISAGVAKMNAIKFILADLLACTISFSFFYWLYLTYGTAVVSLIQKGNLVLFSVFAIVVVGFVVKNRRKRAQS